MMPKPIAITSPIKVHVVPMLARIPNFQSAARRPPTKTTKPTRYIPAHFMTNLYGRFPIAKGFDCVLVNKLRLQFYIRPCCRLYPCGPRWISLTCASFSERTLMSSQSFRFSKPRSDLFAITQFLPIAIFQHSFLCLVHRSMGPVSALRRLDTDPIPLVRPVMSQHGPDRSCDLVGQRNHHHIGRPALA